MSIWRYGLIAVALVAGAQQKPVNFYSVENESELGARLAGEMAAKTTPANNPAAGAYVDRVVRELARQIPDLPFRCAVTIVKDDLGPDPVVLPGGFIYVSAAMLTAAQNESQFAGLLARAVADVAQRTATRLLTRGEIAHIAGLPLAMKGQEGNAARNGMELAIQQGMQQFKRQLAMASDATAMKIMAAAGYDPAALAQYLGRAGQEDGIAGWDAFQRTRLGALRQSAAEQPNIAPHAESAEFSRVRETFGK